MDTDVPHEQSVAMVKRLEVGVEHQLITVSGGGHGFGDPGFADPVAAINRALEFLKEHAWRCHPST
jgi:dipeptidyl aminopeptidase/acylaminoacyl peptidase